MESKKIVLKTVDGFSIAGIHTVAKKNVIVLWLHGITVNKDEYLGFFKKGANYLASFGIDSLRIDFRGHGESSGSSIDLTISGQMIDVDTAIAYLKKFYKGRKLHLNIVACSFGAPPAIFASIIYPNIIKSIILVSPVISYQKTFLHPKSEWAKSLFNKSTISKLNRTNRLFFNDNFAISMNLIKEMQIVHPEASIKDVNKEVAIIHGDEDSMIPYQISKEITTHCPNITLYTFKDMDHGFTDKNDEIGSSYKSTANRLKIYKLIQKIVLNDDSGFSNC